MKNTNLKHILTALVISLITNSGAIAQTLEFNEVLNKALNNSYEAKISALGVGISKYDVKTARSEYFPQLQGVINNEYLRDFNDNSQFASVGDYTLAGISKYQNYMGLNLSYNILDFGVRGKKLSIAKSDVEQKKSIHNQTVRDLKVKIIEIYTDLLLTYKDLNSKKITLNLNKDLYSINERLYEAGNLSKVEVLETAVKLAKNLQNIDELNTKLQTTLEELSFHTNENYELKELKVNNFQDNIHNVSFKLNIANIDLETTPEFKIYEAEIEKKKAELSILKRQRLPQFNFYSKYALYGTDTNNYFSSWSDLENRSLSFGVSTVLPVFDGLKNYSQRKKLQLEIQRLKLEQQQKVTELAKKYKQTEKTALHYNEDSKRQKELLTTIENKLSMIKQLDKEKLIEKSNLLNQKIDLIYQKLETQKSIIQKISNEKKLEVLRETI